MNDDDVKFDSEEELETIETRKAEPAVKEFATPTSLTTVTVIEDLELDDSYQSSTSNKRKAEDDGPEEGDTEVKEIPTKVSIGSSLFWKLIYEVVAADQRFNRAPKILLSKQRNPKSTYASVYSDCMLVALLTLQFA